MEEAPENGKESSHSAHANGIEQNRIEFPPHGEASQNFDGHTKSHEQCCFTQITGQNVHK
jgi:hypothetical protein